MVARLRYPLIGVVVLVCTAAGVVLFASAGGGDRAAGAPASVAPSAVTVDASAMVDRAPVLAVVNRVRTEVGAAPLDVSACLTGVAGELASAFGGGSVPTSAPSSSCGPVRWGWVAGADRSGLAQANSAYGRGPSGPSPLIDKSARHVGLALARRNAAGSPAGYVLVWAVTG